MCNLLMNPHVRLLVGPTVCHNFVNRARSYTFVPVGSLLGKTGTISTFMNNIFAHIRTQLGLKETYSIYSGTG